MWITSLTIMFSGSAVVPHSLHSMITTLWAVMVMHLLVRACWITEVDNGLTCKNPVLRGPDGPVPGYSKDLVRRAHRSFLTVRDGNSYDYHVWLPHNRPDDRIAIRPVVDQTWTRFDLRPEL